MASLTQFDIFFNITITRNKNKTSNAAVYLYTILSTRNIITLSYSSIMAKQH